MAQRKKQTPGRHPLKGRWVAVHPELTTDPLGKQGEVGKIESVSGADAAVATVCFADGQAGRYMIDGLLTLYPQAVILQGLQSNDINYEDRNVVYSVLKQEVQKNKEAAIKLAMANDTTRFFCMTDCASWLDMKKEQRKNQRKSQRR